MQVRFLSALLFEKRKAVAVWPVVLRSSSTRDGFSLFCIVRHAATIGTMKMTIQGKHDVFYTSREAAKYMGLSENTVQQYVKRGLMKPSKRIGLYMLFSKAECDRYLRERRPRGNPGKKNSK